MIPNAFEIYKKTIFQDEINTLVNDLHMRGEPPISPKNCHIARQIRMKGNRMFSLQGKHLFEALELYNESLCMAMAGSEDYGIAFANRSAVYLELQRPDLCLKDIRNARESGYPPRLMEKLNAREEQCNAMLKTGKYTQHSAGSSSSVGFTNSHCVKPFLNRRQNKKFGRFVVTTQRVDPGEVLIVEDSFAACVKREHIFKRCWHCLAENSLYLFPCKNCTQVMFCSKVCLEACQEIYHTIECPIMDNIHLEYNVLALRIIIKGVHAFGSLENIAIFLGKHGGSKIDAFTNDTTAEDVYQNKDQQTFHQVMTCNTDNQSL